MHVGVLTLLSSGTPTLAPARRRSHRRHHALHGDVRAFDVGTQQRPPPLVRRPLERAGIGVPDRDPRDGAVDEDIDPTPARHRVVGRRTDRASRTKVEPDDARLAAAASNVLGGDCLRRWCVSTVTACPASIPLLMPGPHSVTPCRTRRARRGIRLRGASRHSPVRCRGTRPASRVYVVAIARHCTWQA